MAGIENITKVIARDAEIEAAQIITSAEKAADELKQKAEAEAEKLSKAADERLDKKVADERKKIQSQNEQIEKLRLLKQKQQIIEDTLNKAKEKILGYDDKTYFGTLLKILESSVQADKGVMFLNSKDIGRIPDDFDKEINVVATKNGGTLEVGKEPANINGGFILKYGNIEINSSIDALFEENEEKLVDIINSVLFKDITD